MSKVLAEIENAKKIIAEQKERIKQAHKNARAEERKQRDRQNYILGGALVKLAETDERGAKVIEVLLKRLDRPADRKAFETFERLPALALTEQGANDEQH